MTGRVASARRDPFAVLGLSPDGELTDDDVRAAWRRIAAATHPDRPDGGDPAEFAAAAAAYTDLRTGDGRNEARAALTESRRDSGRWRPGAPSLARRLTLRLALRLALRAAIAAAAATAGVLAAGPGPAAPALVVGAATWLLVTAR